MFFISTRLRRRRVICLFIPGRIKEKEGRKFGPRSLLKCGKHRRILWDTKRSKKLLKERRTIIVSYSYENLNFIFENNFYDLLPGIKANFILYFRWNELAYISKFQFFFQVWVSFRFLFFKISKIQLCFFLLYKWKWKSGVIGLKVAST